MKYPNVRRWRLALGALLVTSACTGGGSGPGGFFYGDGFGAELGGDAATTDAGGSSDAPAESDGAPQDVPVAPDAPPAEDAADGQQALDAVEDSLGPDGTGDAATDGPDLPAPPDVPVLPDIPVLPDVPDVAVDAGPDVAKDSSVQDVGPEVQDTAQDVGKDAVQDVVPDTQPDVAKDTTVKDTVADTAKDTGPDLPPSQTCGPTPTIASLLQCGEGPVDFWLKGVLVTYVFENGYFLYDGSTTRGMEVYVAGLPWPYAKPKPGDVIDLHVTNFGNFKGQQEVIASDTLLVTGAGNFLQSALQVQGLPKAAYGEQNESRLLTGEMTVTSYAGSDGLVDTAMAQDVVLRVEGAAGLCAGAKVVLKSAILDQFVDAYRIHLLNGGADIASIDKTGCKPAATFDTSNWGFEEADPSDPPPDFEKATGAFTAVRTTSQAKSGAGSCQMTWTSTENQDLYAGVFVPAAVGAKAKLTVWVLDSDPAGRARLGLTFYKADKTVLKNEFSIAYSADSAGWQQMTLEVAVPDGAASVRGFVRLYDVTSGWQGTATVYIDDFSVVVQ